MEKRVFKIDGMACQNCEKKVENALKAIEGVENAKASVTQKNVEVEYDSQRVCFNQMQEAVDDAGFDMSL